MAEALTLALVLEARDQASEWIDRVRENVDRLAEQAKEASKVVADSADQMTTSLEGTDAASNSAAASMDRQTVASTDSAAAMRDQAAAADQATVATDDQTLATEDLGVKSEETAGKMGILSKASGAIALALVGVAVVATKLAVDFQNSTAVLVGQAGITTQAANKIGDAFLAAGGKTTFTSTQMMQAFAPVAGEFVNMYGHALDASKSMTVMNAAMTLAEAGGGDLTTTTKALADTMMVFHLKVDQAAGAANLLFNTSRLLGISTDTLGTTISRLEPKIAGSGISLKQLTGFMVEFSKAAGGGRSATRLAGTFIQSLVAPSTTATKELAILGINVDNSKGKFIGFQQVVAKLHDALAHLPGTANLVKDAQKAYRLEMERATLATQPQTKALKSQETALSTQVSGLNMSTQALSKSSVMQAIFGKNAALATQLIAAGVPALQSATHAVSQQGEASKAAAAKQATFSGMLEKLKSAAESIFIELGQKLLPVLVSVASATVRVVNSILNWIQHNQTLATVIFGVVTAVFAAVKVIELVTTLTKAWAAAQVILDGALDANPIGLIALAIAALIAVVVLLILNWKHVENAAKDAWNAMKDAWDAASSWFDSTVVQPIVHFFESLWDSVTSTARDAWHAVTSVWDAVASWFDTNVVHPVVGFFVTLWNDLTNGATKAWDGVTNVWNSIASWFDTTIIQPIEGFFKRLWSDITGGATKAATSIKSTLGNVLGSGLNMMTGGLAGDIGKILHLAGGGIVNSPTLAVVGEAGPEMVLPLSTLPGGAKAIGSGGVSPLPSMSSGSGATVINISLTMAGQVYGDVNQALNAMGRQLATVLVPGAGTRLITR